MKKYLLIFLFALGLVAFGSQKAKAGGYFGISIGPAIASLIWYTTGATIPNTIAITTTTTIIRTVTDIGATTVIGAIGTTMMIRPKPY